MYSPLIFEADPEVHRSQILNFVDSFSVAVMLDSNTPAHGPIPVTGGRYDFIAAAGVLDEFSAKAGSLGELQLFLDTHREKKNWVFGFLSYDIKNEIEKLESSNHDFNNFPRLHFFVPKHLIIAQNKTITVCSKEMDPHQLWKFVTEVNPQKSNTTNVQNTYVQSRLDYSEDIKKILDHIRQGDIYELNYCRELKFNAVEFDVASTFKKLISVSPNPFSAFYKMAEFHLLCASPERFLCKKGNKLFSQPIKGTSARDESPFIDENNKNALSKSEKERSENVMIVDLVRNDLSKLATKGSVKTEELFGVYTFPRSHQMISTISCELKRDVTFADIIRATFPMGSMTGAPKISAMKLIEQYENFRRGVFSGTVGYINSEGDFDFNVVIRSILFNKISCHLSISAGGAITAGSNWEKEYAETLLKIAPQLSAIGIDVNELLKFDTAINHA